MRNDIARLCDPCEPQNRYRKDAALKLYRRPGFAGLACSDGGAAERHLADALGCARDRGTFSEPLRQAIVDWPSEYHLSRERHCIVRPLGIRKGDRVLELGCGAVTRYLGEIGAVVAAVEGAPQRARIAAERCGDLPNVTVFNDDVLAFESEARFDWVLLIGVLEYAAVLIERLGVFVLRGVAGILAAIPRATERTRSRNGPLR